tara:strand:+ start:26 stop:325 length:300 start_codon:yes stop_codon:yes gene_type:complete
MTEQEINAKVEAQLDYIQDCCVTDSGRDEIMDALEAGFDVVATISSDSMLASDLLMSCSIKGVAEKFAADYERETGTPVVFLPCGLEGKIRWYASKWEA